MNVDWTHNESGERGHTTIVATRHNDDVTFHAVQGYDLTFNLTDLLIETDLSTGAATDD
jgi:hypothetical protein